MITESDIPKGFYIPRCEQDYGIVANVCKPDRCLRMGSKAWIIGGPGGIGWETFVWLGRNRSGRLIEKWTKTKKFCNFRCAWLPDHVKRHWLFPSIFFDIDKFSKQEIEKVARQLNEYAK